MSIFLFFPANAESIDSSKAKLSNFKFTTGEQLRYVLLWYVAMVYSPFYERKTLQSSIFGIYRLILFT